MDVEDDGLPNKKIDVPDIVTVCEKSEAKKCDNNEAEGPEGEPKPRIVLTFRSEKSNTKSTNMKIVSTEEKLEEVPPRRTRRNRDKPSGMWDWVCKSDTSVSPKKDKSLSASENEHASESDNSHTPPKRTRRRSKDENIIANAIARKEKSYNEATPGPTRLSRRIKPTAKILANEELRIGLESQNNARLGIQTDKSPEEGVRTRRSARPSNLDDKTKETASTSEAIEVLEIDTEDSQNSDMKLEHLCKLGLKAIDPDEADSLETKEIDEGDDAEMLEDEEEIDDDSEVISKLLEADEDSGSDDDFLCSVEATRHRRDNRPRRSTRLCSSYGNNDSDRSSPVMDEEASSSSKARARRSSRRAAPHALDDSDRSYRTRRKKRVSLAEDEIEIELEEESNPAGGDEGSEAACPSEQATVVATCYCETPSNMFAAMDDLTEPIFCQAIEIVDGVRVGCSHCARRAEDGGLEALVRAGPRAPYFLACQLHARQLANHMCCPACGLFCTQGIFYQCSKGHLFHLDCGISELKSKGGCPHCGVFSYRWQPANRDVCKIKLQMKCSNKTIFMADQREHCTPAYLSFSSLPVPDSSPVIPSELLPSSADLKLLTENPTGAVKTSAQALCDAILAGESIKQLIPKIVSSTSINKPLKSQNGGTCLHVAARCGHLAALYVLHNAGAHLDVTDGMMRTPLMTAVVAMLDKPEPKIKEKPKIDEKDAEVDSVIEQDSDKERDDKTDDNPPKDEDLLKVIRYLVAAGCDVNIPDQPESMTPLHVAAHNGSAEVTTALLAASDVNVDARDQGGWTPLAWAAENGHEAVVRILMSHGADVTSTDNEGNSAVHWCALAGESAVLALLVARAPHALALRNKHADTPLHVAARQGHYACVVILLARGARSDVENAAGEMAIDVCTEQCQSAISLNMQMAIARKGMLTQFKVLTSDISNGREFYPLPCINEVDEEPAPSDFTYITQHVTPQPIHIDTTIQSLQGCNCSESCSGASCSCCVLSVREWWRGGRLLASFPYRDPPMLFHCTAPCRCDAKRCNNHTITRLSSLGAQFVRATVYRLPGARGWGLRSETRVLRGSPVAIYCGELLPLQMADSRPDDSYMFSLDVKRDLLEQCTDKTQLCVDARRYGSAARFINHSCRPNLTPVRVFTTTRDLRLPTVTLFASEDVEPGEQFTFDYGDKFWSVKSKWMKCECGSADCRYPTKAEESEAQT